MQKQLDLFLPEPWTGARLALTSVPWLANRDDIPAAVDVASQAVSLFEPHTRPRLRRHLLLCASETDLPTELEVRGIAPVNETGPHFSQVTIRTLKENLDKKGYVYRECEARLSLAGQELGLRMGLLPSTHHLSLITDHCSWWQWCRAERLWSGPLAEAWRVGGHLAPYTTDAQGKWDKKGLLELGEQIAANCGDVLHGDLFLIVWKTGCVQITAHFKAGYFHYWPKPIPAFPVILISGCSGVPSAQAPRDVDGRGTALHRSAATSPAAIHECEDGIIIQPWDDLRVLANKTKDNQFVYLDPAREDTIPPGVSRSFWFNVNICGGSTQVARYLVPPSWYRECGEIETDKIGPAAEMASRSAALIKEHTEKRGFDAGRVWRYLRRDLRTGVPQEDGAEWEGNLAQAMFTLAYQCGESPSPSWELYLQHAYHAADISIYHGSWMGKLECCSVFTAPLPKFRFGGMVYGYLETGDPYLLEVARSLAGVYMAMEWAHQPRQCMGRDAYPLSCLMTLWDYTADSLYLNFAKQTAERLLATQHEDGGFSGQAGAGVLTGTSCIPAEESIGFASGLLAPIALLEWAIRDRRRANDFDEKLEKWAQLMIRTQPPDGVWLSKGKGYPLIGAGALFSLIKAGELLGSAPCIEAVQKYLSTMKAHGDCVAGTHAFLSALYAHVADAALSAKNGFSNQDEKSG